MLSGHSCHHSGTEEPQDAPVQGVTSHTTDLSAEDEEEGDDIHRGMCGNMDD